jgi:hypothetical protein
MEFFVCSCPCSGACCNVTLNGKDQGPNKDASGNLLTKQCGKGQHTISLQCSGGKTCTPREITVVIENTNPLTPKEVTFQCV